MHKDNTDDKQYQHKVAEIAQAIRDWQGDIVFIAHIDPDGDALGSTLSVKRAAEALGKRCHLAMDVPRYLNFLLEPHESVTSLESLPDNTLLMVMDVASIERAEGAPTQGAAKLINVDHHGTNDRFGDIALVQPSKAATCMMSKDIIEAMGVTWTSEIATPCLTGILTDTGNLRFSNTNAEVLEAVARLIDYVDYAALTDRLQWRQPSYFQSLGKVMETVELNFEGQMISAVVNQVIQEENNSEEDSSDYVGLIRYAEGTHVAVLFKEKEDSVKISVRTRQPVSAQAICLPLGGGGHVAAAGAKIVGSLHDAQRKVHEQVERELERHGLLASSPVLV